MRILLPLITALCLSIVSSAAALTSAQRAQHIGEIAAAAGMTVNACPAAYDSAQGYDHACVRSGLSNALFQQTWDLYADWTKYVTRPATHVTAWRSNSGNVSAGFTVNGDAYVVVFDDRLGTALVGWPNLASAPAAPPTTIKPAPAPSATLLTQVNAAATPTRVGPLNLNPTALRNQYAGPLNVATNAAYSVDATGKETLVNTTVERYSRDGRLLSAVTTDANGKITKRQDVTYEGTRMIRAVSVNGDTSTTQTYTYDPLGNVATRTQLRQDGQPSEITRYVTLPNGYTWQAFARTGPALEHGVALQDEQGRSVRSEMTRNDTSIISEIRFEGVFAVESLHKTAVVSIRSTPTPAGRRSTVTFTDSAIPPLTPTVTTQEQLDLHGNPLVSRELEEVTEFGGTTLKLKKVYRFTYVYY